MAVNLQIPSKDDILPISGVEIGITSAGIKKTGNKDVTVFKFSAGTNVAGVFTRNRFRAAPVQICEDRLRCDQEIRALIVNTGNANAGTGSEGLEKAHHICHQLASHLGLNQEQILPFSTGVILEPLPDDKIVKALPAAIENLNNNNWFNAAYSIMTTDTQPKIASQQITINNRKVTITGISKGAGMIRPNMATMLGFVATDADIDCQLLQSLTQQMADNSFNRITVDGDTSTNDSFIIAATGQSGVQITENSEELKLFSQALQSICLDLAQKIVRDAEGATKFVTVQVEQAATQDEALKVAYAIAHSPLVKTAFFASDPNLGRILAAIGYAGIDDLDHNQVKLWLDNFLVAQNGGRDPNYQESDGQAVLKQAEFTVKVALGRGSIQETVYTSDLSHDYVTINSDYRS